MVAKKEGQDGEKREGGEEGGTEGREREHKAPRPFQSLSGA